jgi:hypothetical protein
MTIKGHCLLGTKRDCYFCTDIQEFYEETLLDSTKSLDQKTQETMEMATAWEKQSPMPHREANRKNAEKQVTEKEPLPPTPPPIHEGIERVSEEGSTTKIEPPVEVRWTQQQFRRYLEEVCVVCS